PRPSAGWQGRRPASGPTATKERPRGRSSVGSGWGRMLAHTTMTARSEPRPTRAAARCAAAAGPAGRRALLLAALVLGLAAAPPVAAQGGPPPFGAAQGAPA